MDQRHDIEAVKKKSFNANQDAEGINYINEGRNRINIITSQNQ